MIEIFHQIVDLYSIFGKTIIDRIFYCGYLYVANVAVEMGEMLILPSSTINKNIISPELDSSHEITYGLS